MEEFVAFRRHLHQHPEPSHHEYATTAAIRDKLLSLGVPPQAIADLGGKGLWADLRGTAPPSGRPRCVLLRADIDALTMNEQNEGLAYRSVNPGAAHMCGHDGHVACLAAFVPLFLERAGSFGSDQVVRCLFQPAEETLEGARLMIEKGCLEGVDEVYGFHNVNLVSFGQVAIVKGPFMALSCTVLIRVRGTGGHASEPQSTKYALARTVKMYSSIMRFADKLKASSKEQFTVMFPVLKAGERFNVISEDVRLEGTVRTFSEATADRIVAHIEAELQAVREEGFDCEVTHRRGVLTANPPEQVDHIVRLAREHLGEGAVTEALLPSRAGEDFGEYLRLRPGAFFFVLGKDETHDSMLHVADYDFNDRLIPLVSSFYLRIATDRLKSLP